MVVKSFEFCAGTALYMKYKIVLPQHSCWDTIILCIMGVLMLVIPLGRGCEENQKYLPHPPFLFSAMIITVAAFLTLLHPSRLWKGSFTLVAAHPSSPQDCEHELRPLCHSGACHYSSSHMPYSACPKSLSESGPINEVKQWFISLCG